MIGLVIIITYFIQEFFLLQISLVNINQVVFMQVIATVMVFVTDFIKYGGHY